MHDGILHVSISKGSVGEWNRSQDLSWADTAHLQDNWEEILEKLGEILKTYDVVLLSGGVSKGKFDFLPKALEELGVKKHFHKIKSNR